jgi:hypothetical protein
MLLPMATYSNANKNCSARDSYRDSELSSASRTSVHDDDGVYNYKNNNHSACDSNRDSELLLASRTSVHDEDGGYNYKNNNRSETVNFG